MSNVNRERFRHWLSVLSRARENQPSDWKRVALGMKHGSIICLRTPCVPTGKNKLPVPVSVFIQSYELERSMRKQRAWKCERVHADGDRLELIARYFAAREYTTVTINQTDVEIQRLDFACTYGTKPHTEFFFLPPHIFVDSHSSHVYSPSAFP